MATTVLEKGQPGSRALFKDSYLLHKLHSLSGIVPIGAFLIFHLTANSYSLRSAEAFNTTIRVISFAPFVAILEIVGIFVPILFHAIYGALIIAEMPGPGGNTAHYGYGRNWLYVAQRWSGVIALLYIGYHVWDTTVLKYTYELTRTGTEKELGFQAISYQAMAWRFANPLYLAFYLLGISSACLHLGNGLFNFAIRWGIAIGQGAQKIAALLGWGLGIVLTLLGAAIAINFAARGQQDRQAHPDFVPFVQYLHQSAQSTQEEK